MEEWELLYVPLLPFFHSLLAKGRLKAVTVSKAGAFHFHAAFHFHLQADCPAQVPSVDCV